MLNGFSEEIRDFTDARTSVAAAAIGSDQLAPDECSERSRPLATSSDRVHGERRLVIVDADIHPAWVGSQIINSVRHGAAKLLDQKVVDAYIFERG